jgi:hypothetical protein
VLKKKGPRETHPTNRHIALSPPLGVLLHPLADAFEIVRLATEVDFEAQIAREALDRVVRAAALARRWVVRFGEDEANVVSAVLAQFLWGCPPR